MYFHVEPPLAVRTESEVEKGIKRDLSVRSRNDPPGLLRSRYERFISGIFQ